MRVTIKLDRLGAVSTILEKHKGRVKLKSLDVPSRTGTFKCKNRNVVKSLIKDTMRKGMTTNDNG